MYLVKYHNKNNEPLFMLVVIDSTTQQRAKRYVTLELAKGLLSIGIKCYETINQEVKEV